MSMTLVEAAKLSNDVLYKGIIETIVKNSPILSRTKFMDIKGDGYRYNREATEPTAQFYGVGDTWTESTGTVSSVTSNLRTLGGDSDTDNFLASVYDNVNDLRQENLTRKVKAVKAQFMDSFYYGKNSANEKEFDGLHTLIANTTAPGVNTVHAGADTGTALSMLKVREAIDNIRGVDKSELIIVSSPGLLRYVSVYLDSVGVAFPASRDEFGMLASHYEGIPWFADDNIVDTETAVSGAYSAKTTGGNTSLFILSFGPDGVKGLQQGALFTEVWDKLETKNASRVRVAWYCAIMVRSLIQCAKVDGIDADGTVTA